MTNQWLRLWHDMPTDPKWRTISRISKQPITAVLSVWLHMLISASTATERGRTQSWSDEDVASALDLDTQQVTAIREVMQGRVLDGDYLTGWEGRQPKREDGSPERSKAWREKQKRTRHESEPARPQPNAGERQERDTDTDTDTDTEKKAVRGSRFSLTAPPHDWIEFCQKERPDLDHRVVFSVFADHWKAKPGKDGVKTDWTATWRNWVRREKQQAAKGIADGKHSGFAEQDYRAGTEGFDVT